MISAVVTGPLVVFANVCGNVHGSPCGEVGFALALVIAAPMYLLVSALAISSAPAGVLFVTFLIVTFLVTLVLVYLAMTVRDLTR